MQLGTDQRELGAGAGTEKVGGGGGGEELRLGRSSVQAASNPRAGESAKPSCDGKVR